MTHWNCGKNAETHSGYFLRKKPTLCLDEVRVEFFPHDHGGNGDENLNPFGIRDGENIFVRRYEFEKLCEFDLDAVFRFEKRYLRDSLRNL